MKSRFITLLLLALMVGSMHSLIALIGADNPMERLGWSGALLSTGSFMGFFAYLMRAGAARTSPELRWLLATTAGGTAMALYAALHGAPLLALGYALVIGLDGYLAYVYWYSRFPRRDTRTLAVGNPLPAFTLKDADGRDVNRALIEAGLARSYFVLESKKDELRKPYEAIQDEAMKARRGLWSLPQNQRP